MTIKTESAPDRMSRATALGILAHMAQKRDATLDEVRALQVACRNVAKRLFDNERHFKRKREASGEPPAPPAVPEVPAVPVAAEA